jgi:hypothetical protein
MVAIVGWTEVMSLGGELYTSVRAVLRVECRMPDVVQMPTANVDKDGPAPCSPSPLDKSEIGKCDKLGNKIRQIIWIGRQYAIYLSTQGVDIQFSNDPETEKEQLKKFTVLCPELCELRFLVNQMIERRPWIVKMLSRGGHRDHALYENNMAQALMLLMEDKPDEARDIAKTALAMAVRRVTNDNTIRYLTTCFTFGWFVIGMGAAALLLLPHLIGSTTAAMWMPYVVSAMFGAVGSVFSIMTRLSDFALEPCEESVMNYWMGAIRVAIGVIAAVTLVLFAHTLLGDTLTKVAPKGAGEGLVWETAALLGFIGGYAERLVKSLLGRTIDVMDAHGTPVQAARQKESSEATTRLVPILLRHTIDVMDAHGTPVQAARQKESSEATTQSTPINKEPRKN